MALTTPFPVAIASFPPPINHLTIYTDPSLSNQLQFNYPASALTYLPQIIAHRLLDPQGKEVGNLFWENRPPQKNAQNNGILYWNATAPDNSLMIASVTVETAPISLPVSVPASTTSASNSLATESTSTPASAVVTTTDASTSTTSTDQQNEPTSQPTKKSGVKTGVVAGVAVGCLVAGALFAGLLVWCLLGRRRRAEKADDHESSTVALMNREKGASAQVLSVASTSPVSHAMEGALPQPLEDKAISGEISKISNSIKNHVQSFYHNGRVSPGLLDIDDLQGLGENLPISTGTLSTLLGNSATREIALRFCMAWVIITRMQPSASPSITFLPPGIAEFFQTVGYGSNAQTSYLAKWKVITAELMQSTYVRSPFTATDPRNQSIQDAMRVLEGILQPYADSRVDNSHRRRNLEEILKRSAIFAFTLFSQANSFQFHWEEEEVFKSGSLCVFPALVQIADENGNPVNPPRPFSEAVVRRLDE